MRAGIWSTPGARSTCQNSPGPSERMWIWGSRGLFPNWAFIRQSSQPWPALRGDRPALPSYSAVSNPKIFCILTYSVASR